MKRTNAFTASILQFSLLLTVSSFSLMSCGNSTSTADTPKEISKEYNETTFDDEYAKKDAQFLIDVAEINLEEIKMGQLAQQNSSSNSIKEMGKMMEDAHTKSYNDLTVLAQDKIVTIPTTMNENGNAYYEKMREKKGADFDKEYNEIMIADHKRAIELFERTAQESRDEDVRQFATKTLPVLQSHLNSASANLPKQ